MEERSSTNITDDFLQSLEGMKAAETGPFFYTRLKGRMQQQVQPGSFYKPAWTIAALAFFLTINIWMISRQQGMKGQSSENTSPVQEFAETYNLNSDSNY